jgi:DNA-binding NarL/FixJ family response regulator
MLDDEWGRRWLTADGIRPAFNVDRAGLHSSPASGENGSAGGTGPHHRTRDVAPVAPPGADGTATNEAGAGSREMLRDLRILLVDDCTLHRENLAGTLRSKGAASLGVAWDLPSLVAALDQVQPNIVLVNVVTHDSALLLRATTDINPDARTIAVGISDEDESQIVACAEAGVAGYHMRTESLDDLLLLIGRVAAGDTSCSPSLASMLLRRLAALASERQPTARELALTAREAQILQMLELGLTNHDIAVRLSIAVHTVKNHVHSLLKKLGVSTRAEAAALARAIRLLHE